MWRAQDDNRDELVYDVFYRREGETAWKTAETDITDEIIVWDTSSVPNGRTCCASWRRTRPPTRRPLR